MSLASSITGMQLSVPPAHLFAGDVPSDLSVGDFDRDGTQDLAIANAYLSQVILLFNDSIGTFTTGYSEWNAGDTPASIMVGDFNLDSDPDFAVASWENNQARVVLNQGFGQFGNPIEFPVGQNPLKLVTGPQRFADHHYAQRRQL